MFEEFKQFRLMSALTCCVVELFSWSKVADLHQI